MGNKFTDGKAVDVTVPAGTYSHGDLYRFNNITGFLINGVAAADTARDRALEISEAVWKVLLPAIAPAVGDLLYWTAGAGTKRGDADLTLTVTGSPVCQVIVAKNASGYAAVRLLKTGA